MLKVLLHRTLGAQCYQDKEDLHCFDLLTMLQGFFSGV